MHHKFRDLWENAHFIGTEKGMFVPGSGYYRGWGTTVGSDVVGGAAVQGWAPGALYVDTDAAAGAMLWINEGTAAAASWKAMVSLGTANTWALLQTFTLGIVETNLSKIRIATQTVTDSTTLTADNTLVATLVAGATYIFDINYNFTTINSSGVKIDLNGGGATMTAIQGNALFLDGDAVPPAIMNFGALSFTTLNPTLGLTASGLAVQVRLWGGLVCATAGTFIPQFAQNAETGAAESVIAAIGSSMKLTRVA